MEELGVKRAFAGAFAGRRVLVTGHTGFKGSWLCAWLEHLGADVTGLALAPDTTPSHWSLLGLHGVQSHEVDLADKAGIEKVVASCDPEVIFHLAAQSLVRRSYAAPVATFETNVMGLARLLEVVRARNLAAAFINVTTDKVYRPPVPAGGYAESHALGGHDPYSSSKACAELLSESWRASWLADGGVRLATARAGNVIGGGDWAQDRLIPDMVRAAATGEETLVRNPSAVRPWQHVLEPLAGYLCLAQSLLLGPGHDCAWNFGPRAGDHLSVEEVAREASISWPSIRCKPDPGPHPHEAAELRLDSARAREHLGWQPVWEAREAIGRTIDWYRNWYADRSVGTGEDIAAYCAQARSLGVQWAQ